MVGICKMSQALFSSFFALYTAFYTSRKCNFRKAPQDQHLLSKATLRPVWGLQNAKKTLQI